uniref:Triadin n=1 Tax=Taeniopygia guttata TaxID=59729 RepID=A0A674HB57_TAEGU
MAEITAEGHMSTTTTIIDGKNGSVPSSSMKVGKKSVTEDLVTTFSSPAAWLLVVALIVTWSAVAIVMFDLVDYKDLAGEVEPSLKKEIQKQKTERPDKRAPVKATHRDKPEKQEKIEKKEPPKVTSKDKPERQEKPEKKERHAAVHKDKPEKPEKHEKKAPSKVTQKDVPERHEKAEKKPPPKDQYAFCRYVIDMFAQGEFYPGAGHKEFAPPRLLLEHSPRKKPAAIEGKFEIFYFYWLLLINFTVCSNRCF